MRIHFESLNKSKIKLFNLNIIALGGEVLEITMVRD